MVAFVPVVDGYYLTSRWWCQLDNAPSGRLVFQAFGW
jgi:hypothetical protein